MIVALDANIVIYLVEANPVWGPIAAARLSAFRTAGDETAFCDAGRYECLIRPLASGNLLGAANYRRFFSSPLVTMLPVNVGTWEFAASLGATFRLKGLDCVHLAAAIENKCGLFLTNDATLTRCTAIPIEILK